MSTLRADQCSGVRSLLFSFESQFEDPPEDKFDVAFQAALDIVQRISSSSLGLKRIFFHVNPTREAECDQQLTHSSWEDMDEQLAEIRTLHSAVIVHTTDAAEAQFHHLLPVMQKAAKVEYWPTDIPWWDLEIEEVDESSESNEEDDSKSGGGGSSEEEEESSEEESSEEESSEEEEE